MGLMGTRRVNGDTNINPPKTQSEHYIVQGGIIYITASIFISTATIHLYSFLYLLEINDNRPLHLSIA